MKGLLFAQMALKNLCILKDINILAIRDRIKYIITFSNDTPQRVAFSFAIGVFIGMSPFLGLHTVLGIAVAWLCNLNKFVTIAGVYVTNPWTIIPIYTFATWVGAEIIGLQHILPYIQWHQMTLWKLIYSLQNLLLPFLLGTTITG
ncbi:MAG: DUF2062 domain-containing protein [Thermodesulfovibrionales bacterium]|nr:DUF2062 domain-containing protein [Thermodesulfovibrionales bacterium]